MNHPARFRTTLIGFAILLVASALTAAAQLPGVPRPGAFAEMSDAARGIRDSIVARARAHVGRPYRLGGRSPDRGFDCSGFVQYVLAAFRGDVPRTAAQQASVGLEVERDTSRLRPGDLLTFGTGGKVTHIGIYVGDGRYVHASSVAGRVIESPLGRRAERVKPWRGVRRVFAFGDDVAAAPASGVSITRKPGNADQ